MAKPPGVFVSFMEAPNPLEHAATIAKALAAKHENILAVAGPRILSLSTREANRVTIPAKYLGAYLGANKMPMENVTAILHGHPDGAGRASWEDRKALAEFRKLGFQGKYMIYAKGRFIEVKD